MNIMLLCLVPVRADRLSGYGYHRDTTPHLDRFAAEATTFLNAYAPAPWTPPSYASIMTGLFPWNNGVLGDAALPPSHPTIASHLRAAGYRTAAFVNTHHIGAFKGMDRGFDEFTQVGTGGAPSTRPWLIREAESYGLIRKNKGTEQTTALLMNWLEKHKDDSRPFFLTVHYHEAHHPYWPPRRHQGRYAKDRRAVRRNSAVRRTNRNPHLYLTQALTLTETELGVLSDLYDEEIAYLDRDHLGPVFAHLRQLGLLENTIVVAVSPHGENLGEHGLVSHVGGLYEQTVHVPLIIRHPARLHGVRVADLVQLTDVFPTLLEFIHLPAPSRLDGWPIHAFTPETNPRTFVAGQWSGGGFSLNDLLKDSRLYVDRPEVLATLTQERLMIRVGRFKYVSSSDGEHQLFDLEMDPDELVDVTGRYPSHAAGLKARLSRLLADRVQAAQPDAPPPEIAKDLREIGYQT